MPWHRFGPEWNPVLAVMAVLAIAIILSMLHWWFGVVFVSACVFAFCVAVWG